MISDFSSCSELNLLFDCCARPGSFKDSEYVYINNKLLKDTCGQALKLYGSLVDYKSHKMSMSFLLGVMKDVRLVVMGLYKQTNSQMKCRAKNTLKEQRYSLKARLEKLGPKVSRGFQRSRCNHRRKVRVVTRVR